MELREENGGGNLEEARRDETAMALKIYMGRRERKPNLRKSVKSSSFASRSFMN